MKLTRLLSASRYAACRALFAEPLPTLRKLASFKRDTPPVELKMKDGTLVRLEKPSRSNWLWDHALAPGADASFADGLLRFRLGSTLMHIPVNDDTAMAARWVGRNLPGAQSLRLTDDLLALKVNGLELVARPHSITDWVVLKEIVVDDEYGLKSLPDDLGVVVDCGANIGVFASSVAAKAKRLILVEPVPDNAATAERNLQLNSDPGKATVVRQALGARSDEKLTLWVTKSGPGCNSILRGQAAAFGEPEELLVPTISIADLFERHGVTSCDLFKCDIEGAEYAAFEAAPIEVLQRIRRLRMEYHLFHDVDLLKRFRELEQKLKDAGFRVNRTEPTLPDGSPVAVGYLVASRVDGEELPVPQMQFGATSQAAADD